MDYDVIVIGAGPAGYVAALRASQVGLKAALVERELLGGMCINWGCVPSKAMLESAKFFAQIKNARQFGVVGIDAEACKFDWPLALARMQQIVAKVQKGIEAQLNKNGVDWIAGNAKISGEHEITVDHRRISSAFLILATGAKPRSANIPVPKNMLMDIKQLWQTNELGQNFIVLGGNATAVEIAQLLALAGKKVTLITSEFSLLPLLDPYISQYITYELKNQGIDVMFNSRIHGTSQEGILAGDRVVPCDHIINSENRLAVIPQSEISLETDHGFLKVNEHLATNIPHIFAIGEVNGKRPLAHVAAAEAVYVVDFLKGIHEPLDYACHPINLYTAPEIAQVGLTEPQLREAKIVYNISQFSMTANAKALSEGNHEGFVRVLSEKRYGEILGVQIVGAHATDMIAEAGALMQMEATVFDLAKIVHAHPTLSEILVEAGYMGVLKTDKIDLTK